MSKQINKQMSPQQVIGNNELLNTLLCIMSLKNDAALAHALEVAPHVISKIRHGHLDIGSTLLIRAHEESGACIRTMKEMLGQKLLARVTP
ncbi:hypothetical protein BH11PSE12_BH11PSE12_18440 [soil metagenome]